jgi:hypothetical protein
MLSPPLHPPPPNFIARSLSDHPGHVLDLPTTDVVLCCGGQRRALTSKVNHCTTSQCGVHCASQSASYVGHMHHVQYKTYSPPFPRSQFSTPSFLQQWTDACIGAFVRRLHLATWVQPPPPRATPNSCNGRGLRVTRVRTKTTLSTFRPKGLRSDKGIYVWHNGVNGNHQFYNESAPNYTHRHFRGDATRTSHRIPPFEGPTPRGRRCYVVSVRSVMRE